LVLALSRAFSLLPTLLRLFLVGTLAFAVVFCVCLGFWIVVRLARTAQKEKGEPRR
jgi:hypothetical protein